MKVKLIVRGDELTGQVSPDIITMRVGYFFYFKKAELTVYPINSKNMKELAESDVSGRKFPICYDEASGKYTDDLLEIERFYDTEYPEFVMTCPKKLTTLASNIYTTFMSYLKNQKKDLLTRIQEDLEACEGQLKGSGGPYLNGDSPCLADCIIFPKLYHIKNFFEITQICDIISEETLPKLCAYYKMMTGLENSDHLKSSTDSLVHYYRSKGVPPNLLRRRK